MTPQACTMLALLLVEARDYVREADPGNLDAEVLDMAIDAVVRVQTDLVKDGAR